MSYIMQTENLTKTYGKKDAAKDININIREGAIKALNGIGITETSIDEDGRIRVSERLEDDRAIYLNRFMPDSLYRTDLFYEDRVQTAISVSIFTLGVLMYLTIRLYNKKDIK